MALFIEIKAADGRVSRTRLEAGPNRFTVRLGDSYRILDDQTGLTPDGIAVKRVDNNLIVDGLDQRGTVVEFPEFYNICSAGSPCELTIENGTGGTPVSITPGTQPIGALADGAFVLYDPDFAETAPPEPSLGDGTIVRNVLYGVGGLAVVGLAAGGGGGGGGDDTGNRPDGLLKMTSSQFVNSRTPTLTGEGQPGSRVIVRIDTDGDGTPDVTYGTTVAPDSTWSINLATAVPESGALPAGGLPDASNVGISTATDAGTTSLPTFVLTYDATPPGPAKVDPITADGVVNAAEKQNGFVVTGTAEAGSTVVLSLGAQVVATAVAAADGRWQTAPVLGTALPADGNQELSALVIDRAGNQSATAAVAFRVDTTPPALQSLRVAGENGGAGLVGINEAGNVGFSAITEPGAAVQVEWNGIAKPVTAGGNGSWSVAFTGAEVPAPTGAAGTSIPYSISATDVAGNPFLQAGSVLVDLVAPPAAAINPVTGDDRVTLVEGTGSVLVNGSAEAGTTVNVRWESSSRTATAHDGNWQVSFDPDSIPDNSSQTTVTATAADAVGNTGAAAQRTVTVDQPFPPATINTVAGDNVVNAAERAGDITLSGTVAAGASGLNVAWGNYTAAAVLSNGTWSAVVPAAQIPGEGPSTVFVAITGTGGGAVSSQPVLIDTTPPKTPTDALVAVGIGDPVADSISVAEEIAGFTISGAAGSTDPGAAVIVQLGPTAARTAFADANGAWQTEPYFDADIPATTPLDLTITVWDAVGNNSVFNDSVVVESAPVAVDGSPPALQTAAVAPLGSAAYPGTTAPVLDSLLQEDGATGRFS